MSSQSSLDKRESELITYVYVCMYACIHVHPRIFENRFTWHDSNPAPHSSEPCVLTITPPHAAHTADGIMVSTQGLEEWGAGFESCRVDLFSNKT